MTRRLIGTAAACIAMLAPAATVQAQVDLEPTEDFQLQSNASALEEDLALTAEARGWTVAEARAQYEAAEAVEVAAEAVYARAPETFVGTVLSDKPGGVPSLLLKGPADDWITGLAANSMVPIRIVDDQPYSFADLQDLNHRLIDSLTALGYRKYSGGADIEAGAIIGEVQAQPGLTTRSTELETLLPKDVADAVQLTVTDSFDSGFEHAYGGARVRNSSGNGCTSGWTVIDVGGVTGVTTAGHCDGINEIREHNVGWWSLTHKQQHQGFWGDIEWKTSSHVEPARFYSSASTLRNTTAVEDITSISVGENICLYGRSSNDRNCGSSVAARTWSAWIEGEYIENMVRMNADIAVGGDSGGGWSYGTTAYGSHVGWVASGGRTYDVFTPADYFPNALGVHVRIQ